jgi:thiol-disulfide isomerase/thioredoxin
MAEPVPTPPERQPATPEARRRRRTIYAVTLAVAIGLTVVVGVLVAVRGGSPPPPRVQERPASYHEASPELIAAAKEVGFFPHTAPGAGELQDQPASAARPPSNPDLLPVGSQAPPFTLETATGRKVRLADYRGKAVLLEFFATWCPHCAAQTPYLRELAKSLDPKRFAFLSVNADGEDAASVFAYELYFGLPFPALLDPSSDPGSFSSPGSAGPVSRAYEVGYFPTFYVLDPTGKITWRSDGEQPTELLRQELRRAAGA